MDSFNMGFFVFILSKILSFILTPLSFVGTVLLLVVTLRFKRLDEYFWECAYTVDQSGNVFCEFLFNKTLILEDSPDKFGNPDETISSVLGKNKKNGSFKLFGYILDGILNKIDKNHSIKSIEDDE